MSTSAEAPLQLSRLSRTKTSVRSAYYLEKADEYIGFLATQRGRGATLSWDAKIDPATNIETTALGIIPAAITGGSYTPDSTTQQFRGSVHVSLLPVEEGDSTDFRRFKLGEPAENAEYKQYVANPASLRMIFYDVNDTSIEPPLKYTYSIIRAGATDGDITECDEESLALPFSRTFTPETVVYMNQAIQSAHPNTEQLDIPQATRVINAAVAKEQKRFLRIAQIGTEGDKPTRILDNLDRILGNQTQRDLEQARQEFATNYPAFSGQVEIDEEVLNRVERVLQADTSSDLDKANREFHQEYPAL